MCMTRNGAFQNPLTKGKLQLKYQKSFSGKSLFNTSQAVALLPSNAPSINHLHPIRPIRTRENYSTAMPIPPQRVQVILLPPHRERTPIGGPIMPEHLLCLYILDSIPIRDEL